MFYVLDGTLTLQIEDESIGCEQYMRDLDKALADGTATQDVIGQIASRYDFKPV